MNFLNTISTALVAFVLSFAAIITEGAAQNFPGANWETFKDPSDAGFSPELLAEAIDAYKVQNGAALMVVHRGKAVIAEGDVARKFMVHSIRKSFLNALIGIYVHNGVIDTQTTLLQLGIDDLQPLDSEEKKATILNLLTTSSGVYHPSAYSPQSMEQNLPERRSHKPGSYWYYNNWDFNTLGAIFNQLTGKDFFEDFKIKIADEIGMEDFKIEDCYYRYERDKSKFPAYLFRMSARDMARFGHLYLNDGHWKGKSIVPASWVKESTRPVVRDLGPRFPNRDSYGLLWWTGEKSGLKAFYASGSGGHRISVFPERHLVIVHRTNTYEGPGVRDTEYNQLEDLILKAQIKEYNPSAVTNVLDIDQAVPEYVFQKKQNLVAYQGDYRHDFLGMFKIRAEEGHLNLETNIGFFNLYCTPDGWFYPEDITSPIYFKATREKDKEFTIDVQFKENRQIDFIIFNHPDR